MKRRQTRVPTQWLVADERLGAHLWVSVRRLPKGGGILLLYRDLAPRERAGLKARLRRIARARGLVIADECAGEAARVHNSAEILRARTGRVPLLFLSPVFPTRSHAEWEPLGRMRAAALVRLAKAPIIALGGMNATRFRRVRSLGFHGWAGIGAWIRT